MDNPSGKSNYSDFTNLSTNLTTGETYTFSGLTNFSYDTYDEYWKAWIDYNQDGIFSEPSELAYSSVQTAPPIGTPSELTTGSITIPLGAGFGTTRMRVAMKRGAAPTPCEIFGFGEVEDYSVNIISVPAVNRDATISEKTSKDLSEKIKIYPNPASTLLNLSIENEHQLQELEIFDLTGKKLHTILGIEGQQQFQFNVNSWTKGVYVFHIRLTEGSSIIKRVFVSPKF